MEKLGIFKANEKDWNVRSLEREAERRDIDCVIFSLTDLVGRLSDKPKVSCQGYDLEEFDALIVRWAPGGSAEQIVFRMDVLHRLENLGMKIINPADSIECCADKFYACSILEDQGISVPRTVVAEQRVDARKAFEDFGDVVIKPLFGSLGTGMVRVDNSDLAYRVFSALEFGENIFYIQEFIPHDNRDFRAFVLDNEVLASMERVGSSWKTNIAKDGRAKPYELSPELKKISVKAVEAVQCEYAGVDIIKTDGEYYVVEINAIPGWKALQSTTDINITENIFDYLEKEA